MNRTYGGKLYKVSKAIIGLYSTSRFSSGTLIFATSYGIPVMNNLKINLAYLTLDR